MSKAGMTRSLVDNRRAVIFNQERRKEPKWATPGGCTTPGVRATDTPELEQGKRLVDRPDGPLSPGPAADWQAVRMPDAFAGLRLDYRGYPIFYTVQPAVMPSDRKIDFRVLNLANHVRCAKERRCAVCGQPLPGRLFFVGGPMCVQNRIFGDGPMHAACLRYAMQVCPYMTIATKNYSDRVIELEDGTYSRKSNDPNVILTKPARICIYSCHQYRFLNDGSGKPVYVVEPAEWVEWYETNGTYICRTRPDRYAQ